MFYEMFMKYKYKSYEKSEHTTAEAALFGHRLACHLQERGLYKEH